MSLWKFKFLNCSNNHMDIVICEQEADAWLEISRRWCFRRGHRIVLMNKEKVSP